MGETSCTRSQIFLVISSYKPKADNRMDCYLRCDRRREICSRDTSIALRKNTKRKGCGCRFLVKVVERRDRDG